MFAIFAASTLLAAQAEPERTDGCPGIIALFDSGSARLSAPARSVLTDNWNGWMRQMVAEGAWLNIVASSDEIGPARANLALSRRRGEQVRRFLSTLGAPPDRLRMEVVGETRPIAEQDGRTAPDDVRRQNRYVHVWPEMTLDVFRRLFPPGGPIC